ncbi:MAG: hypothetical protein Q9162_004939 [Coniocarpon cinnabarinum]
MTSAPSGPLSLTPDLSWQLWLLVLTTFTVTSAALLYAIIFIAAPIPRAPRPSEHLYRTSTPTGDITDPQRLACWHDAYLAQRSNPAKHASDVEPADVFMSLVVPAYNEEARLGAMLEETCAFLESEYGAAAATPKPTVKAGHAPKRRKQANGDAAAETAGKATTQGWEVLVVSDGSTDKTADVAFQFARRYPGDRVRVVTLERNRGKGGATTHGLRHVRGVHAVFADADGASRFSDLSKLVFAAEKVADADGRAVAIGSRAHMVGTPAVVSRSAIRNFLMHSFHLLLWMLTPRETSKIKDTQCGFKLFTRSSLPFIVPHMHSEGWIFDVEMLMLAEAAKIPMVEVPIGWKEVGGSKLNVVWDSLGMAWGLAVLRAAWAVGVYRV